MRTDIPYNAYNILRTKLAAEVGACLPPNTFIDPSFTAVGDPENHFISPALPAFNPAAPPEGSSHLVNPQ